MTTVLAIDDEPRNLRLIQAYLADTEYQVLTATSGAEGWSILTQSNEAISVILLDRMMPGTDGIAMMDKLKHDENLAHIPVIMQTAAAEAGQIAEGVRTGVYYYLTKPYDGEVLVAIVQAALQDSARQRTQRAEVKKYKRMLGLIERSDLSFRTLEEARDLAVLLACFFPDPERVILGLSEFLLNAVEHGNLAISYEEKGRLNRLGQWETEIARRLAAPEYAAKRVRVHYEKDASKVSLTIADEGCGFEWHRYLDIDPARATDTHGRGIAISRAVSFDEVRYEGNGSTVTCVVYC